MVRLAIRGVLGAAVLAALLALAPAAAAHSTLIATEPTRDGVVEHSPKHVLLRFDEPVETALGSLALIAGSSRHW